LTAGGAVNGDVTLSVADNYANTVAGYYALAVTGSATITTSSDTASAIYIRENAGTAGTIKVHADQGSAATAAAASIQLTSDIGAVQLLASANVATTEKASSIQLTSLAGSVELWSGLNGADAINIMVDGGSSSGIIVFNDSGTGDESINLNSELGGITVKADAGSIDIEPTGTTAGDLGITVGDDMTTTITGHHFETVTGSTTYTAGGIIMTSSGASVGDFAIVVGDDYTNTVTGDYTLAVTGTTTLDEILFKRNVLVVTTSSTAVLAADTGKVFVTKVNTVTTTFSLPTAAAGLTFTFVDISATAGDDIVIQASSGDTINGGTSNKYYNSLTDVIPASVTLMAVDADAWVITSEVGTWVNESQ
jgi:hypothetical protein